MDAGTVIVAIVVIVLVLGAIGRLSGSRSAALTALPQARRDLILAEIERGNLPQESDTQIVLRRGEIAHLQLQAELIKHVTDREYRGGSQGVSFRLARGVRYHVGSSRGKMVTVGSHIEVDDRGRLTLTSQRIVFTGLRRTVEIPQAKLVQLVMFKDGVQFHASNRVNPPLFRFAPADCDVVGAVVNAAYQHTLP